jgi:hypothetical protein
LADDAEHAAHVGLGVMAQVMAVEVDLAFGVVPEAQAAGWQL